MTTAHEVWRRWGTLDEVTLSEPIGRWYDSHFLMVALTVGLELGES